MYSVPSYLIILSLKFVPPISPTMAYRSDWTFILVSILLYYYNYLLMGKKKSGDSGGLKSTTTISYTSKKAAAKVYGEIDDYID